jgi:ribosomal protein S18 acetylase RimI-like enzyme
MNGIFTTFVWKKKSMNKNEFEIRELNSVEEMSEQLLLLKMLTPELTEENLETWLPSMIDKGYRMIGVFEGRKCIALTGIWTGHKLYAGKYLEIDNFVTSAEYRGKGIGKLLTDHVVSIAKKENCSCVMLDAYTSNTEGHRFYMREGFVIKGFHFIRNIQ